MRVPRSGIEGEFVTYVLVLLIFFEPKRLFFGLCFWLEYKFTAGAE